MSHSCFDKAFKAAEKLNFKFCTLPKFEIQFFAASIEAKYLTN